MEFESVYFATQKQVYLKFWTVSIDKNKLHNYNLPWKPNSRLRNLIRNGLIRKSKKLLVLGPSLGFL